MSQPEQKHRRRKSKRHKTSVIRAFTAEIIIGILFLFGVFLLFEEMEVKSYVFNGIVSFFQAITNGFSRLLGFILGTAETFETSDIVGALLIIIAANLLVWRVRQKAILRFHELTVCPECGGDLVHIHRNAIQRIASNIFFLKIRRYSCKSCEFDGLRMRAKKSR